MMADYGFFDSWLAVILAGFGTFIWRFAGVVMASKIPSQSPLMDWINTMAYAMVAGVLMLMLVHPTGVLAESGLHDRLLGLLTGVVAMLITKSIIPSLLCGIVMFALSMHIL